MPFIKLSNLQNFEIKYLKDQCYKKWDAVLNKMDTSDNWFQGAHLVYTVETDQGTLDLSQDQMSKILLAAFNPASMSSSIQGKTYRVKTNGKVGIEIRYFFDLVEAPVTQNLPFTGDTSGQNGQSPRDRAMEAMEAQKLANMVGGRVVPTSEEPDWSNPPKEEIKVEDIPF